MTVLGGIRQSVERAARLLSDTGLFDLSRGLQTQGWQRNYREARRELDEVADVLSGRSGVHWYREMSNSLRRKLWRSIFLAREVTTGRRIVSSLGGDLPDIVLPDVREAAYSLLGYFKGYSNSQLRVYQRQILDSSSDLATQVERRAREAGDPPPPRIPAAHARLLVELYTAAMHRANTGQLAEEARNPRLAAFAAFAGGNLPSFDGEAFDRTLEATRVAGWASQALSIGMNLAAAQEAYARASNPRQRLQYALYLEALHRCDDSPGEAHALVERVNESERQMNLWLQWVNRHHDHPAYVPRGGVMRQAPAEIYH